jgi:hypothetical protein
VNFVIFGSMEGISAAALQGLSYRELQVLAKKHGLRANHKKQVLLAGLLPFATVTAGDAAADAGAVADVTASNVAVHVASPSKRARKTLFEEALEENDDDVVATPAGAWGETTPVRVKPVDESIVPEENGGPAAGRSPRGIPLKPSGAIDFEAFQDSVKKKRK